MEEKILNEITDFCENCGSNNCCPEYDCVLYRIEQLITIEVETENESESETKNIGGNK